ncbi:KH domain-containing protein [Geitlerinema sp. PCC 9228]|jgi:hypothetical protein|uniref:KH domain-containing protein n=1 Tax=Geitlerinema sp. PCC 9228 TaxID=111611 RepID=UPI000A00951A|nr:KH domain-containing protein [Geitlerinema sp. PCC 9228]
MSSNRSTLKTIPNEGDSNSQTTPNYEGLVRYLVQPFLDSPDSLRLDCERFPHKRKAWIRLAIEGIDKGRVFGRGGRNLQAVRTILTALATAVGESVHLDVYGEETATEAETATGTAGKNPPRKRQSNWSEKPTKSGRHEESPDSADKGERGSNKPRKQRRRSPK